MRHCVATAVSRPYFLCVFGLTPLPRPDQSSALWKLKSLFWTIPNR